MSVKITCIKKDNGNHENPNLAITDLGWIEDGTGKTGKSRRLGLTDGQKMMAELLIRNVMVKKLK